ncbi:hypothetical protein EZJ43_06290 [Pedobacter changchengzhani]|uniref:Uncharacterized protein n=1 Tax=Pedobacter changchengzhani TaxID=2529274 RepID=A0A4R5MNJ2_9SPHI|nr:hypothetical protein [Pedobacter changchengzhani]TDG36885.1 hypothetical protein EZJ43_06290 [Pedobacter changchengzhani]
MIPEKLAELIKLLTEKTKNKKAIWNKGSSDSQFKISVSDGISMTISSFQNNWDEHFEVVVFNNNGTAIQKYITDNSSTIEDFQLLTEFHQAANNEYYKIDETMDELLKSIKSDEVIGNKEIELNNEEDNLPF